VVKKLGKEINVKKIFEMIMSRIWIVLVLSVLFATVGGFYSYYFTKPLYETSTKLIVNADDKLMNTLMVMIKEPSFLEHVVKELELKKTPEQLSQQISAGSIGGSSFVNISVIDPDPVLAAKIANASADIFKREMKATFELQDIRIYAAAKVDSTPLNINHQNMIVLSLIIGIIAGVGLIFLLDFMDNSIRTENYAEQLLEIPVLGSVSKMNKKNTGLHRNGNKMVEVRRHSFETND
jgi:capsular polysaccharide biosynthesis protein